MATVAPTAQTEEASQAEREEGWEFLSDGARGYCNRGNDTVDYVEMETASGVE